jgi:hypothetical protein
MGRIVRGLGVGGGWGLLGGEEVQVQKWQELDIGK